MNRTIDAPAIDSADGLAEDLRAPLRDLILVLADSKRVLGLRYSDRMLGAPTLEAAIAASSMAQDEWGHARLTYALLGDLGEDPKALEHERPSAEYRSAPMLDRHLESWSEMIAVGLLADTALSVQYSALVQSRYTPVHNRVQKLLDEERFHFQYSAGWVRRIAAVPELREPLQEALSVYLPDALQWLGADNASSSGRLVEEGIVKESPSTLRQRFLARVGPLLDEIGLGGELGIERNGDGWKFTRELEWTGWNEANRRAGGALDEETASRARGDKNRALLMD